jgi:hypothetical protein
LRLKPRRWWRNRPSGNPNRNLGLGLLALALLAVIYFIWPYLVGFLAVIGAVRIYRVWRQRSGY